MDYYMKERKIQTEEEKKKKKKQRKRKETKKKRKGSTEPIPNAESLCMNALCSYVFICKRQLIIY